VMAYRKCLSCDLTTGDESFHPICPKTGLPPLFEVCNCGSGVHPRHCSLHPEAYDEHIKELGDESISSTRD